MTFEIGKYLIQLLNEIDYNQDSKDNVNQYSKKYLLKSKIQLSTKIGIKIFENLTELNNAIIGAEGGATGLHETSQIVESNRILICCSNSVFCLEFPTLDLNWKTEVDEITAFEIVKIEGGYIIHGELEITRIDDSGKIIWQNSGADIFITQNSDSNFEVHGNLISVIDWNNRIYKWNLDGVEIK